MADDFDAGICSGNWWNTTRASGGGFDSSMMTNSASCSSATADVASSGGTFSWSTADMMEAKSRPPDELSGHVMDSSPQISGFGLSPSTMDWNQSLLSRASERAEPSFHAMLQEPVNYFRQDSPSIQPNHQFLLDQHHHQQMNSGDESGFPMILQGLFEPEDKQQQQHNIYDQRQLNYQSAPTMIGYQGSSSDSLGKFPQFLKSTPPKQQITTNQLQFSNNNQFWNASAASMSEDRPGFYPSSTAVQFSTQIFDQKPSCTASNLTTKSNSDSGTKKSSSGSSSETALKKPRIETPSPLPTFKVRKEKLGDRITALQQLVSPFGKTDTASVLHEAIEYIKFLHEQVSALSTPYLKNGHPMQHQQNSDKTNDGDGAKRDLRSRGLCLVPIESTYPVASETTADFWTPTFGGTYR